MMLMVHHGVELRIQLQRYERADGPLAVLLLMADGMPWSRLSINTDNEVEADEFVLHHDTSATILKSVLQSGHFEDTGKRVSYGRVEGQPVLRVLVA